MDHLVQQHALMSRREKFSRKHAPQVQSGASTAAALRIGVMAGIAMIVCVTVLAYLPCLKGEFIVDDDNLLTNNPFILAPNGFYKIWCSTQTYDYWPVTNTTFWIEWRLWGMNSTGYHVTNLILHIVEALLIWLVLRELSIPGAFFAAMIFAVHPVNVESVAWISQRKNLMAMLFFLLSILFYLKVEKPASSEPPQNRSLVVDRWYWLSLAMFILAMLSKGSVAILPMLLLWIVWWRRPLTGWDLLRTAPFFVVAVILAEVNMWFQTHGSGQVVRDADFSQRLLGAGGVIWFYLYKAFLPVNLAFVYPQWHIQAGNPLWWLPLLATLVVTAILWRYRKGWGRLFLFAWGFFCLALVPVMGFVDVIFMKYSLVADHYQHIALIGVIALAAAGFNAWHQRSRGGAFWMASIVAIVSVGVLAFLTWMQSGLYRNGLTLYQATLDKNPECWMAHYNLGLALENLGRSQEVIEQYEQALLYNPSFFEAHNNLGVILSNSGRIHEAIKHFRQALELKPDYLDAYNNLGLALVQMGRPQEAIDNYQHVLWIDPDYVKAHYNLGGALLQTNRPLEAIEHYQKTLRLQPDYIEAYNNLGVALVQADRPLEAIKYYEQAIRLKPDYISGYYNLALAYAESHQSSEAVAASKKALNLARSQGQMAQAKQIENWLNSYFAGQSNIPSVPPPPKSALP